MILYLHQAARLLHLIFRIFLGDPPEIRFLFDSQGIKIIVRLRPAVAGGANPRRIYSFESPLSAKKNTTRWVVFFFGDPPEIPFHFDIMGIKIKVRLRPAVAGGARPRRI